MSPKKATLSFERPYKPVPTLAGPPTAPGTRKAYKYDTAMQEAIRRSERQPRLISMNSKEGIK